MTKQEAIRYFEYQVDKYNHHSDSMIENELKAKREQLQKKELDIIALEEVLKNRNGSK